jgi:tRNA(Ile)-lysidine synthase
VIVDAARRFLETHGIRGPLLVAVSGGPDSTALLLALHEIGTPIVAAHVNHHLRGSESDADEAFVRELCDRYRISLHITDGSLDPDAIRHRGIEAAAREVRHARLHAIRAEVGATHIATAHQKNDQAETILMRLMTGGGLAGLRGIHPVRFDKVIRPLLEVSRTEVEEFLRERGIEARIDRMNADPRFLRSRIRALLAQFDSSVIDNLAAVARQAREQWSILESIVDQADTSTTTAKETHFKEMPDEGWIRRALLHRHIHRLDPGARDVSAADLERLAIELDSIKRTSVTRTLELLRRRGEWILRRKPEAVEAFEIELRAGDAAYIPQIAATVRITRPTTENRSPTTQRFQLPQDSRPLFTIRNRRDGDRFQPLGMTREKKLKDFLIDRKIPSEFRDRIPLVLWGGKIVLLAGVEISELFKVSEGGELYEVAIEETNQEGLQREADRQTDR